MPSAHQLASVLCIALVLPRLHHECDARMMLPMDWHTQDYARVMQRLKQGLIPQSLDGPMVPHTMEEMEWVPTVRLGQVVGVAVDHNGDPVVLHRGGRVWSTGTFNASQQMEDTTRLPEHTVVTLDQYSAQVKDQWGAKTFLMPHGLTIDPEGHAWVTDVGLHQVIKFSGANHHPLLTLGEAEVPGSDESHFCQPTSTAVTSRGEVFVADGYCNNRVVKFSANGDFLGQFGDAGASFTGAIGSLHLPHGITLDEPLDTLCVADREGRRVVCYRAGLRRSPGEETQFGEVVSSVPEAHGRRVFDVASLGGGVVVGVAGSYVEGTYGVAFTVDVAAGALLDMWRPREGLHNPHAIAVSSDGASLYVTETGPNTVWKFALQGR